MICMNVGKKNRRGFTLIETVVALAVSMIVVVGMAHVFTVGLRHIYVVRSDAQLAANISYVAEFFSKEVHRSAGVVVYSSDSVGIVHHDGVVVDVSLDSETLTLNSAEALTDSKVRVTSFSASKIGDSLAMEFEMETVSNVVRSEEWRVTFTPRK